jgi:TonB family protein
MSRYLVHHGLLALVAMLPLCGCSTVNLATEGNLMPEKQVATYMAPISPKSAYDTPPKFVRGYAPFFPASQSKRRDWGYALVEFNVKADGTTSDVRAILATAYPFAEEAALAVQKWQFQPARKNGQPVVVKVRLPFTFRTSV